MDYFTSDWHFGHKNILTLSQRPFKDVEEMDNVIIENILSTLKKGDNLYFLGDISARADLARGQVDKILKRKINLFWIIGNHDRDIIKKSFKDETKISFYDSLVIKREHTIIHMNHMPMLTWEKSFYNSFHLYGHIHNLSPELNEVNKRQTGKTLNVNVEFNNYKPYSLHDIFDIMSKKGDNWDYLLLKERRESEMKAKGVD